MKLHLPNGIYDTFVKVLLRNIDIEGSLLLLLHALDFYPLQVLKFDYPSLPWTA
jgi:hypothetical protein